MTVAALTVAACGGGGHGGSAGDSGEVFAEPVDTTSLTTAAVAKIRHHDRTHYRVVTPAATYVLDSASGGLSSMIDAEGNDWIAYEPEPWNEYPYSAASSYRGVPNLVFHGAHDGAGHPGHDRATSNVVGANQIACSTPGGPWAWTWTFEPDYARLDVTGVSDSAAYWFLYEGPAGGRYAPTTTYYATDGSAPAYTQYDHYEGQEEVEERDWYYFGLDGVDRTLEMIQVTDDDVVDHYSLLGNDTVGIDSPDGMVVAGFGRAPGATPSLREPNSFVLRFSEGAGSDDEAYARKATEIEALLDGLQ